MYSYSLTREAKEDLFRIYEYGLGRFGLLQANKYYDMLFDCFSKIASNPYLFSEAFRFRQGYSYCVCGVDTIFYKINSDEIEIIVIIGRQEY